MKIETPIRMQPAMNTLNMIPSSLAMPDPGLQAGVNSVSLDLQGNGTIYKKLEEATPSRSRSRCLLRSLISKCAYLIGEFKAESKH